MSCDHVEIIPHGIPKFCNNLIILTVFKIYKFLLKRNSNDVNVFLKRRKVYIFIVFLTSIVS